MIFLILIILISNLNALPRIDSAKLTNPDFNAYSNTIIIKGSEFEEYKDSGSFVLITPNFKGIITNWSPNEICVCYPFESIGSCSISVNVGGKTSNFMNVDSIYPVFSLQIPNTNPPVYIEMIYINNGNLKYSIGKYEVTQLQWKSVMGNNPSYILGDSMPVTNVNLQDCKNFINKLNNLTGLIFNIPTGIEFDYAASGGETYKYSGSDNVDEVAWNMNNSNNTLHNVGEKKSNRFCIYDMSGNVCEWSEEILYGNNCILGGQFNAHPDYCLVGSRSMIMNAEAKMKSLGFRLALKR